MTPALQRVLERPVAQRVPPLRRQREPRFGRQREPRFGRQREPLFGRRSPHLMNWCRFLTLESGCGCASNSVQPQSLGPSLQRYVVRKSNWFENQLNSAHPQTSLILTNEQAAQTGDSFGDDPFATNFPQIVLTNSKPMTSQRNRCRPAWLTPPQGWWPPRRLRRLRTLEHPHGPLRLLRPMRWASDFVYSWFGVASLHPCRAGTRR